MKTISSVIEGRIFDGRSRNAGEGLNSSVFAHPGGVTDYPGLMQTACILYPGSNQDPGTEYGVELPFDGTLTLANPPSGGYIDFGPSVWATIARVGESSGYGDAGLSLAGLGFSGLSTRPTGQGTCRPT